MFEQACMANRDAIYGLLASSPINPHGVTASNGTAFMVAAGYLVTAAHCVHQDTDHRRPVHSKFELIRTPDIGQRMEIASLHAIDDKQDVAILRIAAPRSTSTLKLLDRVVERGAAVGSLGFPLSQVTASNQRLAFNAVERFQSASISTFVSATQPDGSSYMHYETDSLMYGGSSGCPGFLPTSEVWGMHNRSAIEAGAQGNQSTRLAISLWVPSITIVAFCRAHGVATS